MVIKNWRERFDELMLHRGEDYWRKGRVTKLNYTADEIHAVVEGSAPYDVDILLNKGEISDMTCTCPYAEENEYCKHMAAVLFTAEAAKEPVPAKKKAKAEKPAQNWKQVLDQMTLDDTKRFIELLLSFNPKYQQQLIMQYGSKPTEKMMKAHWQQELHRIERHAQDRDGFIDYDRAPLFFRDLEDFVNEELELMMERGDMLSAFDMVLAAYTTGVDREDIDDSDGGTFEFMSYCESAWNCVLTQAEPADRSKLYKRLHDIVKAGASDLMADAPQSVLFNYGWDTPHLKQNLKLLDDMLAQNKMPIEDLVSYRLITMEQLDCTQEEEAAFLHKYWDNWYIRGIMLHWLLKDGKLAEAIQQLEQEKTLSADHEWRLREASDQLIELYRKTGQAEKYRAELLYHLETFSQDKLDRVEQLHAVTPEAQWPEMVEHLLKQKSTEPIRCQLLAGIKAWDRLFQQVSIQQNMKTLDTYLVNLLAWNAEKTLALYTPVIHKAMLDASTRKEYAFLIHYLRNLRQQTAGKQTAKEIAADWRNAYPRRSAMLDELTSAGF